MLRVAVRLARGGSAALRVAPRALTVGNLTRAASRAGKVVRVTAATGLAGWRSLSAWQKTLVLMDIWDKSADNVLPHNRAERWVTEQIGAALGSQVNRWNRQAGDPGRYRADVVKEVPAGPGSRQKILDWERRNAARLRAAGQLTDKEKHMRP